MKDVSFRRVHHRTQAKPYKSDPGTYGDQTADDFYHCAICNATCDKRKVSVGGSGYRETTDDDGEIILVRTDGCPNCYSPNSR